MRKRHRRTRITDMQQIGLSTIMGEEDMDTIKFQPGDRVRITIDGTWGQNMKLDVNITGLNGEIMEWPPTIAGNLQFIMGDATVSAENFGPQPRSDIIAQ